MTPWPLRLPTALACLLRAHQPLLEQVRDAEGRLRRPHALRWVCGRCRRDLGETVLRLDPARAAERPR